MLISKGFDTMSQVLFVNGLICKDFFVFLSQNTLDYMEKFINQTEKLSELFYDKDKAKLILSKILVKINNLNSEISRVTKCSDISLLNWSYEEYEKEIFLMQNQRRVIREINSSLKRHIKSIIYQLEMNDRLQALDYIQLVIPTPSFLNSDNIKSSSYRKYIFPRLFFKELELYFEVESRRISNLKDYEYHLNRYLVKTNLEYNVQNEYIVSKKTYKGNFERGK